MTTHMRLVQLWAAPSASTSTPRTCACQLRPACGLLSISMCTVCWRACMPLHLDGPHPGLSTLPGLTHWPNLRTLDVASRVELAPGFGSRLVQLSGLQSLSLQLWAPFGQLVFSTETLHGSHLQQLTQLTSLSLGISIGHNSSQGSVELVSGLAALTQLRSLRLDYNSSQADEVAATLGSALLRLAALTSLDFAGQHSDLSSTAAMALLHNMAALPTLQHVGVPHCLDITQCAHTLASLTALRSLRLHSLNTTQEPDAAQLLSRLTRLQAWHWQPRYPLPAGRAAWLAQLQEVTVGWVALPVLADLPPDVRIKTSPPGGRTAGTPGNLEIICPAYATEREVRDAVARLLNSSAVKHGSSTLTVSHLQPAQCAAIRPLAEAASRVEGLQPSLLPHVAGWQLRGLVVRACTGLAKAAGRVRDLSMEIHWEFVDEKHTTDQELVTAVQQLCQTMQGLRRVVSIGPSPKVETPEARARCQLERQRQVQVLQQAVKGAVVELST